MIKIIDSESPIHKRIVPKKWGREVIIHNGEYCGKILEFNKESKFSMHFHSKKTETWIINEGEFWLTWIDTKIAEKHRKKLVVGNIIHIEPNTPHQLESFEGGKIFEVSTQHFDDDSYRVEKGDSQL